MHIRSLLLSSLVAAGLCLPFATQAAVQGTVRIDQLSPKSNFGTWTLLTASGTVRSSTDANVDPKSYSYSVPEVGEMVLSVTPPEGMSSKISIYRNGELVRSINAQQYEFQLYPNDNYKFLVQYAYTKLGTLGVTSNPSGLTFRVTGPKRLTGKTPMTFTNLPAGRYSIRMSTIAGCSLPPQQSAVVTSEGRATKLITLTCDSATEDTGVRTDHPTRRSLQESVEVRESKPAGERK